MVGGALWVDQVSDLVRMTVDQMPDQGARTLRLASADPDPERGPGWFLVRGRLSAAQLESVLDGRLRSGTGDLEVLEVTVQGDEVRVRVPAGAPRLALDLHGPAGNLRRILAGLAAGLDAVRHNRLLAEFAAKTLTPDPDQTADAGVVTGHDGLRPGQRQAVAAACAPGLHLIWAPPGTGVTRVIAATVRHLAGAGRRVLLVSATPDGVDAALQRAVRALAPGPGEVLRIGSIHRSAVAADERVSLALLTEDRQAGLLVRAGELQARIASLTRAGAELARARAELAGFDPQEYQQAGRRVADRAAYERQQHDLGPAEAEVATARRARAEQAGLLLSLACREAGERRDRARTALATLDTELTALTDRAWSRARNHRSVTSFRAGRVELVDEIAAATSVLGAALEAARAAGVAPGACGDRSRAEIETGRDAAAGRLKAALTRLGDVQRELSRRSALELAGPEDQALVTEQGPLWKRHRTLPDLIARAEEETHRRRRVEHEHALLRQRITQERRQLERELAGGAQVVATTLAQLALRPWIGGTPFDHVIVDAATTAEFPHVVHALGLARVGAVLVGDPLAGRPLLDPDLPLSRRIRNGFGADCFAFLGVTDPASAQARPGCVALTEQFRSGPALTELANRAGYQGALSPAAGGADEIVVITVDGLPPALLALHGSEGAAWWAVGALLARALAEHHTSGPPAASGSGSASGSGAEARYREDLAVLTGSGPQAGVSAAVLGEAGRRTPVGTAAAVAGRSFDTVLVDLGADANAPDAVRLLAAAATRPRQRLYVALTRQALADPGAVLPQLIEQGTAQRVDAGELLGPASTADTPAAAGVRAALAAHVGTAGDLVTRIDRATASIWCWSPDRPAPATLQALGRAGRRGVDVHLVTRPPTPDPAPCGPTRADPTPDEAGADPALPHAVPAKTVLMHGLTQHAVVVDQQWVLLPWGDPGVVIVIDSPALAGPVLADGKAEELSRPRQCRQCLEPVHECRQTGGTVRRWMWMCSQNHHTPFVGDQQRR